MIARSLLLLLQLSCKNFNVAHYSKSIKGIITKLGILDHHDKMQLQDKGNNSDFCSFGFMALFKLNFFLLIIFKSKNRNKRV